MTQTIIILLVTQFFAMMSPGPDMLLIIRNTVGQSRKKPAVFTILGIASGLSAHITLSIAGFAIFLSQSELLFTTVRYTGAAYLAYLGFKSLWKNSKFTIEEYTSSSNRKSPSVAFREGLFTNLLNPKVTLFILSLFTQLIGQDSHLWQKLTYGGVLIGEAIVVWLLFAAVIGLPVVRNGMQQWALWIDRVFGLILVGIALSVVLVV